MIRSLFRFMGLLAAVGMALIAQNNAGLGSISGVVQDPAGAVVPGAVVVVENASKGIHRELQSNGSGAFTATALIPAPGYHVKVSAKGFNEYNLEDLDLRVGQNLSLPVSLAIGQASTTVEVSASAPLLEDTRNDVSQVVSSVQLENLPINGRRVDSFVLLTPGVHNDGTFGLLSFRGVAGNNSFLLDGNDNTEQFYDENAGRTRMVSQVSQDAVQEFQVVSSNFSTEYGKAMGGVVNTVTKSGGNDFHGTGFYYFRSTGFDARDPFASFTPTEHRIQVGATAGGKIIKDKLFYFLSTDITRRNFPMVDSLVSPGVIDPVNQVWVGCGAPATPAQCAAINQVLPRFFGAVPRTADNDLYFGRLDYNLNEKNTLSASFNFLRWYSPNGIQTGLVSTSGSAINGNGNDAVRVRNGKFTLTTVASSSLLNLFRFGWDTDRQADDPNPSSLGAGLGLLDVSVAGNQLGPASYVPRVEPSEQRFEFADDVTWNVGSHIIKIGGTFSSAEDYTYYIASQSDPNGSYSYQTVTQFAEDYSGNTTGVKHWQSYGQQFGNPIVDATIKEYGAYINDQWKATDRLTFNIGVRYERSIAPWPPIVNPDWPLTGQIHTASTNFMPRAGFSFRLNDKTVIRAGAGTFYARFLGSLVDNLWTANGLYQNASSLSASNSAQLAAGPSFPNILSAPPAGSVGASTIQFAIPNLKTPYSAQSSVAVERQIGQSMALTVSGIFSKGINLYGTQDVNVPAASGTYTYTIDDINGNAVGSYTTPVYTGARPNPKYGAVYEVTNGLSSWYDGLTVQLERRYSHGLQSLLAYTWSHEIDDGQGGGSNALFYNSTSSWLGNGNYIGDKGSGTLDQRHRFVYSLVWAPTLTKSNDAFARYFLNNWQLSAITTFAAGMPAGNETIRITSSPLTKPLTTGTLSGFSGSTRVPWLPVNYLYTPAWYHADVRITKIVPIGEHVKLSLIGEAFNISNSWSATSMNTQCYSEAKGILTPTPANIYASGDGGFPDGTQARRLQVSGRLSW
jgi:hypothetical protein